MTTVKFNNLSLENARLKRDVNAKTTKEIIKLENEYKSNINNLNKIIDDKDKEIDTLKADIAKIHSIMNNNSSNSGIPTSKTKIGEKKYIPNSREMSNKSIGGQKGHKKHKLYAFSDEEATEIIEVTPERCPNCKSNVFIVTDNSKDKRQTDYTVKVIKKKYKFKECICNKCNNKFHVNIPNELKEYFPKQYCYGWDDGVITVGSKDAVLRIYCTDKIALFIAHEKKKRNNLIEKGIEKNICEELDRLNKEFDNIIKEGKEINIRDEKNYEKSFIEDIIKYKENYLKWCYDFKIPSTNNNSERNIRLVKSKLKISGQFQNINYAKYYATIRSYIETCKRFNKNIIEACNKLLEGNPYTLKELLNEKND